MLHHVTCVADFHCVTNAWRRRKAHLTRGYSLMRECLVIANYHWGSKAEIVRERERESVIVSVCIYGWCV